MLFGFIPDDHKAEMRPGAVEASRIQWLMAKEAHTMAQRRDLNKDGEETTTGGELLTFLFSLLAVGVVAVIGTKLLEKTVVGSDIKDAAGA